MDILAEISTLEKKVTNLQTEQNIAKGKLQSAQEALEEAGFKTVEEAEAWCEKETDRLTKLEKELEEDVNEFKNCYQAYLA
jgi:predicted transcriptional regulator